MPDPNEYRCAIQFIRNKFGDKELIGCEVGVKHGLNAGMILRKLNIKKIYLIDPYIFYEGYGEHGEKDIGDTDFERAKSFLKDYDNDVEWIIKMSEDAVDDVDEQLDFVYIDGNHSYEYVKQDLELWYPKVKIGGVISGHDFQFGSVRRAVREFTNKNNLNVSTKLDDWWFVREK